MKLKTLGVLAVAVVALAGLAYVIIQPAETPTTESVLGQKLFEDLQVRDIDRILITGHEGQVTLHSSPDGWAVADRNGFPADFSRIAELVKKVQDLKIGRSFQASEEIQTRLALHIPGKADIPGPQKGTRIRFETDQGAPLVDMLVGSARQSSSASGGQYVMPLDGSEVYLVDKTFRFLNTNPVEWLNRELLNVETDHILRIEAYAVASDKPLYTLMRTEPETDFTLKPAPSSGQVEQAEVKRVTEALTPLRIEDVQSREKPITARHRFEYTLSDNRRYTVTIGEKKEADEGETLYRVQLDAGVIERSEKTPGQNPSDPEERMDQQKDHLSQWTYLVSEWEIDNFITDPQKFTSSKEPE